MAFWNAFRRGIIFKLILPVGFFFIMMLHMLFPNKYCVDTIVSFCAPRMAILCDFSNSKLPCLKRVIRLPRMLIFGIQFHSFSAIALDYVVLPSFNIRAFSSFIHYCRSRYCVLPAQTQKAL